MGNLFNDAWSGLDFWDKEENIRQKQKAVKPMPARAPNPDNQPGFQLTNNSLTRGVSRGIDQINFGDGGRTWKQRTPTQPKASAVHQFTHNGATNVVGQIVKQPVRMSMAINQAAGNLGTMAAGGQSQNAEQFYGKRFTNLTGYKGTKRQFAGDTIGTISTVALPGTYKGVEAATVAVGKKVAPQVIRHATPQVVKKVAPRVIGGTTAGATSGAVDNTGAYIAGDEPITRRGVTNAAKDGFVTGAALGAALPIAAPVAKYAGKKAVAAAKPVAKKTAQVASKAMDTPQVAALKEHNTLLQQQFEKSSDPRVRNAAAKQIAINNQQINAMRQGGYVKVPTGIRDPAPDLRPAQKTFINDYAEMLQGMDSGNGVQILPDGTRATSNSPFYRATYAEKGRAPTKEEWFNEARKQIESGKAAYGASDDYSKIPFGKSIPVSTKSSTTKIRIDKLSPEGGTVLPNAPSTRMSRAEFESLAANAPAGTERTLKVKAPNNGSNIPVMKMQQQGDVVTATNVNPAIKAGEKRYALNDKGELIPDDNGAYSIFKDEQGRVTDFRVGDKVFNANDLGNLGSVNGYGSSMATMRRNFERAFDPQTGQKLNNFLVDSQQSAATRLIERQRALQEGLKQLTDDLGISFGIGRSKAKAVSAAIQDFGEKRVSRQALEQKWGKEYASKIIEADKWFKSNYDSLLNEANDVLTKHGYDPIPKRKNYYTHFQDPSTWQKFGLKMQEFRDWASPTAQDTMPGSARGKINNKLAGQSEFMEPNKRFNKFALQRKGAEYTSDAFQAFERYLNPTLNNIYMTPSITKARVVSRVIADEADLAGKDANHIIVQTREWANRLAGKSNRFDRPLLDSNWGNKGVQVAQFLQRRAGANTIVGNIATAVKQPIVLAQTVGKFGYKNTLVAIAQELSSAHAAAAPIRKSEFMRRRYTDLSSVTRGKTQRAADIANTPLRVVEETSARITWNSAYNDALEKGMSGRRAIKYADVNTEKTLAGRSIGERPELFESKAAGPITMYQLEVANYIQQVGKEMTPAQVARTFTAAFALNLVMEKLTGQSIGFDPISAGLDTANEVMKSDKTAGEKTKAIAQRWAGETIDNTPIVGPVINAGLGDRALKGMAGKDSNTGRFGVSSPISTLATNPQYMLTPFGGSQIKKTYQGVKAVAEGQLVDKKGNVTVNIPQTPQNFAKGALFGKGSLDEVSAYNNNIGKKKVDQLTVPNQSQSKASKQGGVNDYLSQSASAATPSKYSAEAAKEAIKAGLPKDFTSLKEDDKKKWAQGTPDQRAIYDKWKVMKNAFNPSVNEADKYTPEELDFKKKQASFTEKGRETWGKRLDGKYTGFYEAAVKELSLPADWHALPKSNKVVGMYIDYQQKQKTAKNALEKSDNQKEFLRAAYKTELSGNAEMFFAGNKYSAAQLLGAVEDGTLSMDDLKQAVSLDNYLKEKGLSSSYSVSSKLRALVGYGSGSGSRSGKRTTSRSKRKSKTSKVSNIVVPTYSSTNKKLQSMLKSTRSKSA